MTSPSRPRQPIPFDQAPPQRPAQPLPDDPIVWEGFDPPADNLTRWERHRLAELADHTARRAPRG